jgi:hypothetical protein
MAKSPLSEEQREERAQARREKRAQEKRDERQRLIADAHDRVQSAVAAAGVPLEGGSFGTTEGGETFQHYGAGAEQYEDLPALASVPDPVWCLEDIHLTGHHKLTHGKLAVYLREIATHGAMSHAAMVIGMTSSAMVKFREAVPEFADLVREAQEFHRDSAEREVVRRAVHGVLEPVFSPTLGTEIGVIRKYSDRLLEVLVKGNNPNKFRENVNVNVHNERPHILVIREPIASVEDWQAEREKTLQKREIERLEQRPEADEVKG